MIYHTLPRDCQNAISTGKELNQQDLSRSAQQQPELPSSQKYQGIYSKGTQEGANPHDEDLDQDPVGALGRPPGDKDIEEQYHADRHGNEVNIHHNAVAPSPDQPEVCKQQ